jgi:hypothetical protein
MNVSEFMCSDVAKNEEKSNNLLKTTVLNASESNFLQN